MCLGLGLSFCRMDLIKQDLRGRIKVQAARETPLSRKAALPLDAKVLGWATLSHSGLSICILGLSSWRLTPHISPCLSPHPGPEPPMASSSCRCVWGWKGGSLGTPRKGWEAMLEEEGWE